MLWWEQCSILDLFCKYHLDIYCLLMCLILEICHADLSQLNWIEYSTHQNWEVNLNLYCCFTEVSIYSVKGHVYGCSLTRHVAGYNIFKCTFPHRFIIYWWNINTPYIWFQFLIKHIYVWSGFDLSNFFHYFIWVIFYLFFPGSPELLVYCM